MSEMKNFKVEFVERTLKIIKDDKLKTEYEVTLLLNCLLGMITLPIETTKDEKSKQIIEDYKTNCINELKLLAKIEIINEQDDNAFRSIRNSIAHLEITPINSNGVISSVKFKDYNDSNKKVLSLTIEVNNLKKFAIYVAEEYLKIIR
ncbi:MAG: hypothetical protein IJ568_01500 [Bacilli bacterium]|nr:hypothetical protein [Bacilli bacterium]